MLWILIFSLVLTIGLIVGFFVFFSRRSRNSEAILLLQKQLEEIRGVLDNRLNESARVIQEQFSQSAKIIREVTASLVKLDETNKQVINFADQLKSLQDVLRNPKQRGVLGEYYLETVLKNTLPPTHYQMQYRFKDGEVVDAVIFLDRNKILPIDSKFSLENYNRLIEEKNPSERERLEKIFKQDLKNRIDETAKYIRPDEGTMDFAFMFIPAEAIYYDLLINQVGAVKGNTRDLIEYAFQKKHVIIVSPTSFMAYLQTVLQGLRALEIEESAKEIRKRVEDLGRHLKSYEQFMLRLGNNLSAAVNSYNSASQEFKKIDKDILKIAGRGVKAEHLTLDKPAED